MADLAETSHPQRDKRTYVEAKDQHGRLWENVIDISAKPKPGPVSTWNPKGWTAPLIPDQKYIRWSPDNMFVVTINYRQWKEDRKLAWEEWVSELHQRAAEMSPGDAGASLIGKSTALYEDASPALLRAVGKKRLPVEPVIAAEQGNSWVLGKTTRVDQRLIQFFPTEIEPTYDFSDPEEPKYQDLEEEFDPEATGGKTEPVRQSWNDFQKEAKQRGLTARQAAEEWNAKKAVPA